MTVIPPHKPASSKTRQIIPIVAEHFGTTSSKLLAKGREEPRVTHRQIAMLLCEELSGDTQNHIAAVFGRIDDQIVQRTCVNVKNKALSDKTLAQSIKHLREVCATAIKNKAS